MKIRSTGLGKTELVGHIEGIKRVDGYLVLSMRTTEPVRWHVRVAMTPKDLRQMLKTGLKGSIIAYVLSKIWKDEEPAPIKDY